MTQPSPDPEVLAAIEKALPGKARDPSKDWSDPRVSAIEIAKPKRAPLVGKRAKYKAPDVSDAEKQAREKARELAKKLEDHKRFMIAQREMDTREKLLGATKRRRDRRRDRLEAGGNPRLRGSLPTRRWRLS